MANANNISLRIIKLKENNNNTQIFCNAYIGDSLLRSYTISCWQTKDISLEECFKRVWFDMSLFAKFLDISTEEVSFVFLNEEEISFIKQQTKIGKL